MTPKHPCTHRIRSGLTVVSRHSVGICQGNELTRNLSGNTRPQSSQVAEQLWTDHGLNSERNWCVRADHHFKTKPEKRRRGINHRTFPKNFGTRGQSHQHTTTVTIVFRTAPTFINDGGQFYRLSRAANKYDSLQFCLRRYCPVVIKTKSLTKA